MIHKDLFQSKGLRKFAKSALSLSLVCALALTPNYSLAANAPATTTTQTDKDSTKEDFASTSTIALQKAKQLVTAYGCTSVQYALTYNGEIVVTGTAGLADKATKKAPTNESIYGIGSISKMFTTVAVMQLVERGLVELDAPVIKYIPDFKMKDERYKDITVRMLLNHSSGLMGNLLNNTMLFYDPDNTNTEELLEHLSEQRLKAAPGSYSVYSNDGFTLAEILIERVTNSSYTDYVYTNITKPLGMTNTKTPQSGFPRVKLAKAYYLDKELPADYANFIGAGGMYSTAEDLCRFLDIFNNKTDILSPESVKAMAQPEYLRGLWGEDSDNILNYGLGWDCVKAYPFNLYDKQAFVKGGDTYSYHGSVVTIPSSNLSISILSCGGSSGLNEILANEILLNALLETKQIDKIKDPVTYTKPEKTTMPSTYTNYEGCYANNQSAFKIEFTKNNSFKMITDPKSKDGIEFFYCGDGIFKDSTGSTELSFKKLSNNITYLNLKSIASIPGFQPIVSNMLYAQKLEANQVSKNAQTVWEARCNKRYYLVSEKYSSQLYLNDLTLKIDGANFMDGYIANMAIVDENHLETRIQIPMNYGRDLMDVTAFTKNGTDYLKLNSMIAISEDSVKNLSSKKTFNVKINSDGYAKWYTIPESMGGKKIKVTIPKNSGVAIYDNNSQVVFLSTIEKNKTITLPKGGKIVFTGAANSTFTVNYK